jgi:hypothetical protein
MGEWSTGSGSGSGPRAAEAGATFRSCGDPDAGAFIVPKLPVGALIGRHNQSMAFFDPQQHMRGPQVVNGQLVLVGSAAMPDGTRIPTFLPVGLAHTVGCMLIELAQLARERESELRQNGAVLDVGDVPGFSDRLEARMRLNGSIASLTQEVDEKRNTYFAPAGTSVPTIVGGNQSTAGAPPITAGWPALDMARIWLTYAWADNTHQDVDFVAQELTRFGLTVRLDRWNLGAGRRLWEQIESFIQDPAECDAWVLYATPNSLSSEACKEEFAYALDRALKSRGDAFPIIGLSPSAADNNVLPAGIRTRLHVSTRDVDWKERIKAAAENRPPQVARPAIDPVFWEVHPFTRCGRQGHAIELRPRAGTWPTFYAGVPVAEKALVNMSLAFGPAGRPPITSMMFACGNGTSNDGKWWCEMAQSEASSTQSYYVLCDELPSKLNFGLIGTQPQYTINFGPPRP